MAETFASRLAEDQVCVFHWVRISGIPILFCAVEVPAEFRDGTDTTEGTAFDAFDGESYTWSETLVLPDNWGNVGGQMQPKGGMPQSGNLNFTFRVDGLTDGAYHKAQQLWLSLMQRNLRRQDGLSTYYTSQTTGKTANLSADFEVDDTTMAVVSNPWNGASAAFDVYVGLETIRMNHNNDSSTQLGNVTTRGAYGSWARWAESSAKSGDEVHATGIVVSDFPVVWEGRVIELYMTLGTWAQIKKVLLMDAHGGYSTQPHYGQFMSYARLDGGVSEGLTEEPNTKLMYRGLLTNVREGGDNASVVLETCGLEGLIEGDILARTPEAKCGLGPAAVSADGRLAKIYLDNHNWRVSFTIRTDENESIPIAIWINSNGSILDGDTLTFNYPNGSTEVFTARIGATLAYEFDIGGTGFATLSAIYEAIKADGAEWSKHFRFVKEYDSASDATIVFRWVSGEAGAGDGGGYALTTSPDNNGFAFSQATTAKTSMSVRNLQITETPGLYSLGEVTNLLNDAVADWLTDLGLEDPAGFQALWFAIEPDQPTDGSWTNKLALYAFSRVFGDAWSMDWFTRCDGEESFLRDLGFVQDSMFVQRENNSAILKFVADKRPAWFRWPRKDFRSPGRLYLYGMESWDAENMTYTFSHFRKNGTIIGVRFGIIDNCDMIQFDEGNFAFWNPPGGNDAPYVVVDASDYFSFGPPDEFYIEIEDPRGDKEQKEVKFERVIYFQGGQSVGKTILQLLIGGSGIEGTLDATYDVGWLGCGLAIPGTFFDLTSFENHSDEGYDIRHYIIRKGDKIRDILDNECKLAQIQICAGLGQIYLATTDPVLAADEDDAYALDETNTISDLAGAGVGLDRAENRIVNLVNIEGNYDAVRRQFFTKFNEIRSDSKATWGSKEPMTLNTKGTPGFIDSIRAVERLALRIFAAYAVPYAVFELYVTTPYAWLLKMGDAVMVTNNVLPSELRSQRGIEALPCKIFGLEQQFLGGGQDARMYFAKLTLVARPYNGSRTSRWAPSAYMASKSGAVATCTATYYSHTGVKDVSHFAAGDKVVIFFQGTGSVETKTIDSVNEGANTITFTASISGTAPGIICYDDYNNCTATQQRKIFLGDNTLTVGSNGIAFRY